jgi:hypothetical protein
MRYHRNGFGPRSVTRLVPEAQMLTDAAKAHLEKYWRLSRERGESSPTITSDDYFVDEGSKVRELSDPVYASGNVLGGEPERVSVCHGPRVITPASRASSTGHISATSWGVASIRSR